MQLVWSLKLIEVKILQKIDNIRKLTKLENWQNYVT